MFTAFATVEEIGLDVLQNREKIAARLIRNDVPVGAGNTAGQRSCIDNH